MANETVDQQTEDTSPSADDFVLMWDNALGRTVKVSLANVLATKTVTRAAFSAYRGSAQNATAGAFAKINFTTEVFDHGSNYTAASARFVAPVAGYYQFRARVAGNPANVGLMALFKNGAIYTRGNHQDRAATIGLEVNGLIPLAATDYVEAFVFFTTANAFESSGIEAGTFDGFLVHQT